jgi:L-fuculose-phosphate aldolase
MNSFDLTQYKVVTLDDIEAASKAGATELLVRDGAIFTPSARDAISAKSLATRNAASGQAGGSKAPTQWDALFHSPEAEVIKAEIVGVGRKLWQRMYVDGNGGNISCRLTPETVICTPTLISKADMTPEDLCLVDLSGNQLAGGRPRTSEILMHLEIYKEVPEAKSVVHCHPPHATAYAIVGRVPPTCIIPEFEVFVGRVALSPYETPGTQKFAETVIPFVKNHNCLLLSNHGIVCWADTATHAEWYAEVLDTYCWTLMNAAQLGAPITTISPEKTSDLLAIKQRMGMPDARLDMKECQLCDMPELGSTIALPPPAPCSSNVAPGEDVESIIQAVTDAVMAALAGKATAK